MDKKIVKVIYNDNSEDSVGDILTSEQIKEKYDYKSDYKSDYLLSKHYTRQFNRFEIRILSSLNNSVIKEYAIDEFDLVEDDEKDCKCKDICDYEDFELIAELSRRNNIGYGKTDIISVGLLERFTLVLGKADNNTEIENVISNLETKYNL